MEGYLCAYISTVIGRPALNIDAYSRNIEGEPFVT